MLEILGRATSVNVRKALWTADELGVAYVLEPWGKPLRDPETAEVADSIQRWTAKMQIFEAQLAETGVYAAGAVFSFADIPPGPSVYPWFGGDFERPELANVAAYYAQVKARPAAIKHLDAATP